jgi:tryptophan-rich sensory protein
MALFIIQMVFNLAWSPVFFAMHEIAVAFAVILAMICLTAAMIPVFWRVRPIAGALLLPYLAWLCFASVLNYQFLALNPLADGARDSGAAVRVQI